MASFINRFNTPVVIKRHEELRQDVKYDLLKVEIFKTKNYGTVPLVTLQNGEEKFKLFLGKLYLEAFDESTINHINEGTYRFRIQYKGVNGQTAIYSIE